MAFRQSTFPAPHRRTTNHEPSEDTPLSIVIRDRPISDFQEWVLFSPTQTHSTTQTQTPSTGRTTRTAGLSRLSDFGSLNTVARSQEGDDGLLGATNDEEELDSLDDGLHAFREIPVYSNSRRWDHTGGSILPAHDGLGSFAASSLPAQEQIWNFERHNPHRRLSGHHARRPNVQVLQTVEDEESIHMESSRMDRIEEWRLEQSKMLLEDVGKEPRRRRMSHTSEQTRDKNGTPLEAQSGRGNNEGQDLESLNPILGIIPEGLSGENESLWQRITRRVIHDLMGIDDALLSVIFGEALPMSGSSTTGSAPTPSTSLPSHIESRDRHSVATGWEERLLSRLARELGILVHQLSGHPGAFSTYLDPSTLDYAGIPIIQDSSPNSPPTPTLEASRTAAPSMAHFTPTLREHHLSPTSEHVARWGIEEAEEADIARAAETRYWEATPDLKTVFTYLQRRFLSQQRSLASTPKPMIATANTPDTLHRAALIRQHHPLMSHARTSHVRRHSVLYSRRLSSTVLSGCYKRTGTSCASASTKRSRREASEGERNYWDLGESVGTGSGIAALGGMGAWGEV